MKNNKILFKTIIDFFSYILLSILIFLSSFFAFYIIENVYARVTNTKPLVSLYVIVSPSMVPTININDMIIDFGVNKDSELKENDIITFYSNVINTNGFTITHRINSINKYNGENRYITKGDNNSSVDVGYTTIDRIVGKVFLILPKVGAFQSFLSSKWGWLLIVIIPSLGILFADIYKLIQLFKIKNEIIDIKPISDYKVKQEIEANKKIRELVEKSDSLKRMEEDNHEEG